LRGGAAEVRWGWWSEQERTSKMCVCKRKSGCVRNSRMCSESRRRWDCAGAGAGMLAARVAARRSSGSGRVSVACAEDGSWGKTTAAAGRRAARGICRQQEVALIGSQRQRAAVKRGLRWRQVRRGEGRGGQRGVGEGSGEAGKGTWPGAERRWDGGGGAHGRPELRLCAAEKQRREGGRRRRTRVKFSKRTGTPL
jgi:hypothetical protein